MTTLHFCNNEKPTQHVYNPTLQNPEEPEQKITENCLFVKKAPLQRQDFQPVKPANM